MTKDAKWGPMPHDFPIFSRFSDQCARGQLASTSNGSNRPPRPAHSAAEPPGYYRFSRAPRPTASYVQFLFYGRLALFQCSDTRPTGKRHKRERELGDPPGKSAGGSTAPRSGRVSIVYVQSIVVFSFRLRPDESGLRSIFKAPAPGRLFI